MVYLEVGECLVVAESCSGVVVYHSAEVHSCLGAGSYLVVVDSYFDGSSDAVENNDFGVGFDEEVVGNFVETIGNSVVAEEVVNYYMVADIGFVEDIDIGSQEVENNLVDDETGEDHLEEEVVVN